MCELSIHEHDPPLFFHGTIQLDKTTYYAFTITNTLNGFSKNFYILNTNNLNTFIPQIQPIQQIQPMSEIDKKYLKYKMKYTNLKRKLRNNNIL